MGSGFALTDGSGSNGVLVVAEALGEDEARAGKPLVGRAGTLFNRMLGRTPDPGAAGARLKRDDFGIANVVSCRPPGNVLTGAPYEHAAIDRCASYLRDTITKFKPRAILAMGNQPLRWFTGHWGIEQLRGYRFTFQHEGVSIPVVPTYHPSYIQRGNFELVRVWQLDVLKALAIARGEQFDRPKEYVTHPSPERFREWAQRYFDRLSAIGKPRVVEGMGSTGGTDGTERREAHSGEPLYLSFDIETPYIKGGGDKDEKWKRVLEDDGSWLIFRISFSFEPFKSISVPWTGPYLETIKRLLGSSGDKVVWNRHFDVPRVVSAGAPAAGRIVDGMELWHYLEPSLPMGLKYVSTFYCPDMQPWKLMSKSEPEWYNAADADTALRTTLALRKTCESQGRWETFLRHVVDLGLVLDALTIRGVNVDKERRAIERVRFEGLLEAEELVLQSDIPDAVRPRRVYKSNEAKLRDGGTWVEGRMVLVTEPLTEKEQKAWIKKQESAAAKAAKAAAVAERKAERERARLEKAALKLQKSVAVSGTPKPKRAPRRSASTTT